MGPAVIAGPRMLIQCVTMVATLVSQTPASAGLAQAAPDSSAAGSDRGGSGSSMKGLRFGALAFDLTGQARVRYEYDDGFTLKGYTPGDHDPLLLERVRLDFNARWREGPRAFLQLQDAHAFLTRFGDHDFAASNPIEDALDLRQFYLDWSRIGGSPVGFRIGRQQISYGDQRVFGPGNWGNTGRFSWDAVVLKFETDRVSSDLWMGDYLRYKSETWPDRSTPDFLTLVDYVQIRRLPVRLDVFYVLKHDASGRVVGESGTGDLLSHTLGVQAEGRALRRLDGSVTLAGQCGRYGQDQLRAFGASTRLGVTLPAAWTPRVGGQFTWGSGDRDPSDGVHGTFDGVYGGRDIFFYGYLNLFFWANLRDYEVDISARPRRALTGYLEAHHFALDQARDGWYTTGLQVARRDRTGRSGTTLGDEADARVAWAPSDHLELMAGLGRFFPGSFVAATGAASQANWYFGQTTYSW